MIDTTALKNSILDLAFQGKLTSQNVTDGSAEELYNQICDEKRELIKSGKIKKNKIVPIKEEDIPFEIPNNWKWIRWGDLSEKIQYGYNAPAKSEGRIKMVRISDIQDNKVLWDTVPYCEIDEEQIPEYLLKENDILFARTGGTVGKSYIVSDVSEDAVFAGYLIRTSYSNKLSSQYMKYFMESKLYWKQLRNGTIATAQPNCNGQTLSKMMVPLPPYAEQVRIIETIEKAFAQIDVIDSLQQQYSSDLEVLKSKIIDAGIQGKLTEQLPEDGTAEELLEQIAKEKKQLIKEKKMKKGRDLPNIDEEDKEIDIPQNWEWVRLGDIAQIFGGKRIPAGRSLTTEDTGHKYIRVSEMKNRTVITDNLMYVPEDIYPSISRYIINKEDVYITVAGTIGRVGTIPDEIDGANLTENADRVVFKHLNKDWLVTCLDSSFVQKQIAMVTTQVAQPKLAIKRIEELIIPLPPLAEQERIADKIVKTLALLYICF